MAHCLTDECKKKRASNSEVANFSLPKDPQSHQLAATVEIKAIYHQMFLFARNTLKTNILINHGIYKLPFFTQADQ